MVNTKVKYLNILLILFLLMTSCVKDVDFEQAENIRIEPVVTSSIVFTEVQANRFSVNGMEIDMVSDSIDNIQIFEDQFVNDNLVKADLVFEVTNTINRVFNLEVEFLNDADELQYSFSFDVSESPSGNAVITEYTEVIEDENLDALKLTTQMILKFTLPPSTDGSMLNENSTGKISLKSKGIFYFNINL